METSAMLKTLQDPLGLPFYPLVFQILAVLTFALHITFVNFTVGTLFLSVYGHLRGGDFWKRLSAAMAKAAIPCVSIAMVLGIAPLLFIQVLYDPFWYTSSVLSGRWAIGFIIAMMIAYSFLYVFYFRRQKTDGKGYLTFGLIALLLFLLSGFIMHVLNYQALLPDKWLSWYTSAGTVDASGGAIHAFSLVRFLHFIVPAFALTGIFLMMYAWYFEKREDFDKNYLERVGKIGSGLAFHFTTIQVLVGFLWLLSLPAQFKFMSNPFFVVAFVLGIGLLALLYNARRNPIKFAVPAVLGSFLTVFAMSYAREALRVEYVGRFAYSIFDYKVNLDWGSTLLFLITFVLGLVILGYLLTVVFKSGRVMGEVAAAPGLVKWGKVSIGLLVLWMAGFFVLGIFLSV